MSFEPQFFIDLIDFSLSCYRSAAHLHREG